MKFVAPLEKLNSAVYGHCVFVPQAVSDQLIKKNGRRVICTLNDIAKYQCALMPMGNATYFVNITKSLHKQLNVKLGSKISVELEADTSEYGLPVPEELVVLFDQDQDGYDVFHSLTPGKQRSLLHIIGKPKSSDLRLKKALTVINYLKMTGGRLDFKELNNALKNS